MCVVVVVVGGGGLMDCVFVLTNQDLMEQELSVIGEFSILFPGDEILDFFKLQDPRVDSMRCS